MDAAPRSVVDAAAAALRTLTFDQRMAAGLLALMALLPLLSPVVGGSYLLLIGERVMIFAIAALSLELLIGVGGLVSFGHAAYLGIGAYAAGILASHGLGTLAVALPAALVGSALFALATGAVAVRTRGVYFIMITLAFGQMAFFIGTSLAPYGGDDGLSLPTRTLVLGTRLLKSETAFFYVILLLLAATYVGISRLVASRFGRVLRGLTDNETRMQAIGFTPYPYRLTAYVIAGTLCGLAGFLLGNQAEFVSPAYMHWQRSGELIIMVLLGRHGHALWPHLRRRRLPAAGGDAVAPHRALEGDPGATAGAGGAVRQGRHRRGDRGLAASLDDPGAAASGGASRCAKDACRWHRGLAPLEHGAEATARSAGGSGPSMRQRQRTTARSRCRWRSAAG